MGAGGWGRYLGGMPKITINVGQLKQSSCHTSMQGTYIYIRLCPRFDSGVGHMQGSWTMVRHVSCILLLEWSTTSQMLRLYLTPVPYVLKDSRLLRRKGQAREY